MSAVVQNRNARCPIRTGFGARICSDLIHECSVCRETFAAFADVVQKLGNWKIIAGIVMPDHVHLLAAPNNRDAQVGEVSAGIKRAIRKRVQANWRARDWLIIGRAGRIASDSNCRAGTTGKRERLPYKGIQEL